MKKIIVFLILCGVLAIGMAAWLLPRGERYPAYTGPVETIRLASSKAAPELSNLVWIAESLGYFKEQKLDVKIAPEANGILAEQKVARGEADIANTSDFGFVSESFTTDNVRILASIAETQVVEVIASKDSGISKPADLVGKRIGVTLKAAPEYFLSQFLLFNRISQDQVTVVSMSFADMQEAILSGSVDAVVVNDPVAYQIKSAMGAKAVAWPAQGYQNIYWLLVGNTAFLEKNPEATERFLTALLKASEYVASYDGESRRILREKFELSADYINQNWKKNTFRVGLDQSLIVGMEAEARWRIQNNLTDKTEVPNYLNHIYFNALDAVKPEAITIIH